MRLILSLGLSLLEVVISLFIFSFILLGLDVMGVFSSHLHLNAYYASLAEQQLRNMEERLRVLEKQADGLDLQIQAWNEENAALLPQGNGVVSGSYPSYLLMLTWGEKTAREKKLSIMERVGCIEEQFSL